MLSYLIEAWIIYLIESGKISSEKAHVYSLMIFFHCVFWKVRFYKLLYRIIFLSFKISLLFNILIRIFLRLCDLSSRISFNVFYKQLESNGMFNTMVVPN